MKSTIAWLALVFALAAADGASAWGHQGHQLIGAMADGMLNNNAAQHVHSAVGSLKLAATWPDCVRSVRGKKADNLHYVLNSKDAPWCSQFETDSEIAAMVDYVKRNLDQCVDEDPSRLCHAKYHFADVAISNSAYSSGLAGTNDHDVVHAIEAAVAKLEGRPTPPPFDIKDEREALLLLAHFVGDLHQPLHVGAAYLDSHGQLVDPGAAALKATQTEGGNLLQYASSGSQLHGEWDAIPTSWRTDGTASYKSKTMAQWASETPPTPGDFHTWPQLWATDTVMQSHTAFAGLSFGSKRKLKIGTSMKQGWRIVDRPDDYTITKRDLQRIQIEKAARHLADLLNAIWPDNS